MRKYAMFVLGLTQNMLGNGHSLGRLVIRDLLTLRFSQLVRLFILVL